MEDGLVLGRQKPQPQQTAAAEQKAPEQPVVEQKTEIPPEQKTEAPAAQEWKFDVSGFSKWAGQEFKDEDEVKSSLKSLSKFKDYDDVAKERDDLKTKFEESQALLDPRKYFVSDDEYRRQQVLMKYPDYDRGVISKVLSVDEKSSDVDVLIAGEMLKGIDAESARELIVDRFNLSENPADWDKLTLAKLKSESVGVRKALNEMKNVELPKPLDVEAARQTRLAQAKQAEDKLRSDATPFAKKIMEGLKEVNLPFEVEEGKVGTALSFEVDAAFKKDFEAMLVDGFVKGMFTLDEAGLQAAYNYAAGTYMNLRLPQMISRYKKNLTAEFEDKKHEALHNDKPLNQQQAPPAPNAKNPFASAIEQAVAPRQGRVSL